MQPDSLMRESLRFGFEREGVAVAACGQGASFDPDVFEQPAELIIAGGRNGDEARSILSLVRGSLNAARREPPVLYVGNGIGRSQALSEGATEFLGQPVYVRDAVTVAKLLTGRKRDNPSILIGDLREHFGLLYLVRAISALNRRGVLTLVRGMRRGELRFYDGEVTSAQVGLLHGLAALHQLLLWTEGRFELRPEDVVRRQQIPLEPNELFAEAERFLSEICAVAGPMSPSACYERDEAQIGRVSGRIPREVTIVLRLFDGVRTVADVVEDCHFRVFETLGIANRLCELGLIRLRFASRPRHAARAALAIEEWLVGDQGGQSGDHGETEDGTESDPAAPARQGSEKAFEKMIERLRRRPPRSARKQERGGPPSRSEGVHDLARPKTVARRSGAVASGREGTEASVAGAEPIVVDWAQLLPNAIESELVLSPVVPSAVAAGEISVAMAVPRPEPAMVVAEGTPVTVQLVTVQNENGEAPHQARPSADTPTAGPLVPERMVAESFRSPVAAREVQPADESAAATAAPAPVLAVPASRPRRSPGQPAHWSASEEAFFARGSDLLAAPEPFDDLEQGPTDHGPVPRRSFWRRLLRVFRPKAGADRSTRKPRDHGRS